MSSVWEMSLLRSWNPCWTQSIDMSRLRRSIPRFAGDAKPRRGRGGRRSRRGEKSKLKSRLKRPAKRLLITK